MAVPKKKRYKQVVRTRRFLQQSQIFVKNKISLTKFKNYIVTKTSEKLNSLYCNFCKSKGLEFVKQLCVSCYNHFFVSLYSKKLEGDKEEFRRLDYEFLYYVKLSETFFPFSRS